jgi:hypothetical protein
MLDNEAYRRARGDHISERTRTKELAIRTGLAAGYIANIIARKRRLHEQKINVSNGRQQSELPVQGVSRPDT